MFNRKHYRIAVIIPVYNVTEFLQQAITSVVEQTYRPHEVIVVNDGSDVKAAEQIQTICNKFSQVRLIGTRHQGAAAARDEGAANSTADHIVFLDSDDLMAEGALKYFVRAIKKYPDAAAVYARSIRVDAQGRPASKPRPPEEKLVSGKDVLPRLLRIKQVMNVGTVCINKIALGNIKANNHHLTAGEDWVLWCHLALTGKVMCAGSKVVLHYRRHDQNTSTGFVQNPDAAFAAYDSIFKNPLFSEAVGKEALREYEKECHHHTHMMLATYFGKINDTEKARFHMEQLTLPVSEYIVKRRR